MPEITIRQLDEQPTVVMRTIVPVESIPAFLEKAFTAVAEHIGAHDADFAGPPFARYLPVSDDFRAFEIEAGFPVASAIPGEGEIEASTLPGGEAATVTHIGPYAGMRPTYEAITDWLGAHQATPSGAPWEVYLSDPVDEPDPASWRTDIVQPYQEMAHAR
ncbi:MAG: GyrI-like domain-containing protein [Acidimicrobiia bacterium]